MLWTDTYCRNPDKANADSYANWVVIGTDANGLLWERTNNAGNGQTWKPFGSYKVANGNATFDFNEPTEINARIITTIHKRLGTVDSNAGGYGNAYCKATLLLPTVNKATGRKLTAAPSILNGAPTRDKNRNLAHEAAKLATLGCGGKCKLDEDCIHCG